MKAGEVYDKTARSSDSREYTVGASCVNALSSEFNLYVRCGGKEYEIDFSKGRTTKHLYEISGHFSDEVKTGTEVSFVLDKEVWGNEWFNFSEIKNRLHELTYLNPGLTVVLDIDSHDLEGNPVKIDETFVQTGGLQDYIADKTKQKNIVAAPFILSTVEPYTVQIHPSKTVKGKVVTDYDKTVDESREMTIDISAVNTDSFSSDLISFVNNVRTEYGGDHETGFKMGIFNAIKKYLISKKLIKNEKDVESDDCREGMIAIVSVKLTDPNFEGQGKGKIRMNIVRQSVKKAVEQAYTDYLNEDDNRAQAIMEKVLQAIKAKEAARRARNIARGINNIKNSIQAVDKFADCSSKDPDIAECFLVEGKVMSCSL